MSARLNSPRQPILWALIFGPALFAQNPAAVDFARDIQPLFRANCYGCHGPSQQSGGFRLDRRRDSMPNRVGANGARIVPGNSAASRLYVRVSGSSVGVQMPPTGALAPQQIERIKAWIDQGAEWPDELADATASSPPDPRASRLMNALRRGDRAGFEKELKGNPQAAQAKGPGGSTPLMYAALYGDAASVRLLLNNGADPNIRNDAGATALLWGVDDPAVARLLLERGADGNARSEDGVTPLMLAAAQYGSAEVLRLLLDSGARPAGQPLLARAAAAGDETMMRMLIDRGAVKPLPRDLAIRSRCLPCTELLLPFATHDDLNAAAAFASRFGGTAAMKLLVEHGADKRIAAQPQGGPADAAVAAVKSGALRSPRAAVEKSLPLLQHADLVFLQRAGCISCHNNSLFQMTAAAARRNRLVVDERAAQTQLKTMGVYIESWRERVLQDIPIPGGVDTIGYILAGLAAADYPPDAATDALARYLKCRQAADGGWRIAADRPPIESSDFEATSIALRALQVYAPPSKPAGYAQAVQRGLAWLSGAVPESNEDRVFQLLGLGWAHASKTSTRKAGQALIALQRPDGGWAQLPSLASDAYATGQALTALAEAGGISAADPAYRRGVRFLLSTQGEDGSWHVKTRAMPVQPYFDSEFPGGRDQFISAAATNWAAMALAKAAR